MRELSDVEIIKVIFRIFRLELQKEDWYDRLSVDDDNSTLRVIKDRSPIEYTIAITIIQNHLQISINSYNRKNHDRCSMHDRIIYKTPECDKVYIEELNKLFKEYAEARYNNKIEDVLIESLSDLQDELILSENIDDLLTIVNARLKENLDETESDNN